MSYDPARKFTQPGDGVVFIGQLTDEEGREGDARIAAGEDAATVWRDISRRDPERWRREGHKVGKTLAEIETEGGDR